MATVPPEDVLLVAALRWLNEENTESTEEHMMSLVLRVDVVDVFPTVPVGVFVSRTKKAANSEATAENRFQTPFTRKGV